MRFFKCFLVVILLVTALILPVHAKSDIEAKADILNKLSILKGSGDDYNLDGQLRRSEASAFIVRLLGKENFVLQNKEKYAQTSFPDVSYSDWFAAYVGYCVDQGIITGYVDGYFKPNDNISEKSFLKMVLCALGYKYVEDFTWSDVYQFAYEVGIVDDTKYISKTSDENDYKRANVVDVLYKSLSKVNKSTKTKQIYLLIDAGIINLETAVSAGILSDSIPTDILLVTPIDSNKISVKLNENIKSLSPENIYIYESKSLINRLNVMIESQTDDEILIKTSDQTPDVAYTVELMGVEDTEGNVSNSLIASFTGYRSAELKSDFFRISKVECVSKNVIYLYYTHPVNINSEIASNYEIYRNDDLFEKGSTQTMNVKLFGSVNNAVMITLKNKTFENDAEYVLKVNGELSSAYGVKLNDMKGDSIRFKGKADENQKFELVDIDAINERTIMLNFNMEVNPVIAQQVFSYYITDNSGNPIQIDKSVVSVDGDGQGKCVTLTLKTVLDKSKTYNIMINNINDITRQFSITEVSYTFSGYYPDKSNLEIINVSPIDAGTIAVFFDKPLDTVTASMAANFSIIGITHNGYISNPVKTYYDPVSNPYLLKLFLSPDKQLQGTCTYKLRVLPSLRDHLGNSPSKILDFGFNGNGSSTAKPTMSDAVIISVDTIKVTFNKEIAIDVPNLLNTNYILEHEVSGEKIRRIPSSVLFYNATTLILKFDALEYDVSYTLSFIELKDYSGYNIRTQSDGSNSISVRLGK